MKGIIFIMFIVFLVFIGSTVMIENNKDLSAFVMIIGCIIAAFMGIISDDMIFTSLCVALAVVSISGFVFGADKSFAAIGIYNLEILYCGYHLSREVNEAGEVIKNGDWAIQTVTVAIMILCGLYFVKADLRYSNLGDSLKHLLERLLE